MNTLSDSHDQLVQRQQSGVMNRFALLPMDQKLGAIALSSLLGITCSALAWTGTTSDRIYFCLQRPDHSLQCRDHRNRPYRMTPFHWQQWQQDGMPEQVVLNTAIGNPDGIIPASNPYKPLWALGAFVGFALTGYMLRHLQHEEQQLSVLEAIAQKRDEAVADMNARVDVLAAYRTVALRQAELDADVELLRQESLIRMQQAEVLGDAEIEIARLDAEDARFEAQTAGMTDEQRQEYIAFLRSVKTPFLPGQTLDGIAHPGDKVAGQADGMGAIAPAEDDLLFDIQRINPPNPTQGKNLIIIAEQGVGKTTLAKYLAGETLQSNDIQVYDLDDDRKTWGNLPVWGTGDDESEIAGAMQADMELFDQRTKDRVAGRKFGLSARIVDENPSVYDAIAKTHEEWTFKMGSRARKRGFVVILLTQERDPAVNGLSSNRLRNYNQIYLGRKQVNHALNYLVKPKAVADILRGKVNACARPALIEFNGDWFYWNVPDLTQWEQTFNQRTTQTINPTNDQQLGLAIDPPEPAITDATSDEIRQKLEFILHNSPSPTPELPQLTSQAEALHRWALKQKKAVTPRDVGRAELATLKGYSKDQIIDLFSLLQTAGLGRVSEENGTLFFYPLPPT